LDSYWNGFNIAAYLFKCKKNGKTSYIVSARKQSNQPQKRVVEEKYLRTFVDINLDIK
jgi:hypothetical protein